MAGPHEHPVLTALAKLDKGVFQEVFMLDARLAEDLRFFCSRSQLSTSRGEPEVGHQKL